MGDAPMTFRYFHLAQHDDVTVAIIAKCRLRDDTIARAMADELVGYVKDLQPRKLVVDFSSVDVFRDLLACGLLQIVRAMRSYDGKLILAGMHQNVREVVRILGLDGTVFRILDSVDDAVQTLKQP